MDGKDLQSIFRFIGFMYLLKFKLIYRDIRYSDHFKEIFLEFRNYYNNSSAYLVEFKDICYLRWAIPRSDIDYCSQSFGDTIIYYRIREKRIDSMVFKEDEFKIDSIKREDEDKDTKKKKKKNQKKKKKQRTDMNITSFTKTGYKPQIAIPGYELLTISIRPSVCIINCKIGHARSVLFGNNRLYKVYSVTKFGKHPDLTIGFDEEHLSKEFEIEINRSIDARIRLRNYLVANRYIYKF